MFLAARRFSSACRILYTAFVLYEINMAQIVFFSCSILPIRLILAGSWIEGQPFNSCCGNSLCSSDCQNRQATINPSNPSNTLNLPSPSCHYESLWPPNRHYTHHRRLLGIFLGTQCIRTDESLLLPVAEWPYLRAQCPLLQRLDTDMDIQAWIWACCTQSDRRRRWYDDKSWWKTDGNGTCRKTWSRCNLSPIFGNRKNPYTRIDGVVFY